MFTLKKEQRTALKVCLGGKGVFTLLFGKTSLVELLLPGLTGKIKTKNKTYSFTLNLIESLSNQSFF